jgi:type IV pilus assembly protein PilN
MTTRINLLPHREERRKRARQHFFVLGGATAVLGALIVGVVYTYYENAIETQKQRNQYVKNENAKLDKEIAEIQKLRDEINALLARKRVIEDLQADRAQTVYLLDQLVRQMPEGVYLKSVVQKGRSVNLLGYAQSNARVSTLMRNVESSPWLTNPVLVEIRATTVEKRRVSEFNLNLSLKQPAKDAAKDAAKTPAKAAAAKKG